MSTSGQPSDRNKKPRDRKRSASHQRSWLRGKHAVIETLQAGRWPVEELYLADSLDPSSVGQLTRLAAPHRCRVEVVSESRLKQLCGTSDHQGYLARMGEFPAGSDADWLEFLPHVRSAIAAAAPVLIVICDRIQDAHNFGAILRCCDGVAVDAVVFQSTDQAPVTPHVARSSSGAVNHLSLFQADDLCRIAESLLAEGCSLVAASEKSSQDHWHTRFSSAVALVVGSESTGIRPELLKLCSVRTAIPMLGKVGSLNAAVAAGILLYEIRRQQQIP